MSLLIPHHSSVTTSLVTTMHCIHMAAQLPLSTTPPLSPPTSAKHLTENLCLQQSTWYRILASWLGPSGTTSCVLLWLSCPWPGEPCCPNGISPVAGLADCTLHWEVHECSPVLQNSHRVLPWYPCGPGTVPQRCHFLAGQWPEAHFEAGTGVVWGQRGRCASVASLISRYEPDQACLGYAWSKGALTSLPSL